MNYTLLRVAVSLGLLFGSLSEPMSAQQQTLPIVPVLPAPVFPVAEQPVRPGARMKKFDGGKILAKFDADAGDRDVVVERWDQLSDDGLGPPPGTSEVAWRTIYSPVVIVLRVTSVESYLSEGETWIESRVTGNVTQLLKDSRSVKLRLNAPVTFVASGGRIKIGDNVLQALTRTRQSRTAEFSVGADYLIFFRTLPGEVLFAHPENAFQLAGNRLLPMRPTPGGRQKRVVDLGADAVIAEASASRDLKSPLVKKERAQ